MPLQKLLILLTRFRLGVPHYAALLLWQLLLSAFAWIPLYATDNPPGFHTGRGVSLYNLFMDVRAGDGGSPSYYGSWSMMSDQQRPVPIVRISAESSITIDSATVGAYGTSNIHDGTHGPWWISSAMWNAFGPDYKGTFTRGSSLVTGLTSTTNFTVGQPIYNRSDTSPIPNNPWPTIVEIRRNSIVLSRAATSSVTTNFYPGLLDGNLTAGQLARETFTYSPSTFPNNTYITWKFPSYLNGIGIYAFPGIEYGSSGYEVPRNSVPALQLRSLSSLSATWNITVNAGVDDLANCMFEFFVYSTGDPSATPGHFSSYAYNEISIMTHVGPRHMRYLKSLSNHFWFSTGGYNFYVVTNNNPAPPGQFPPQTSIVPVTAPGGTTPLSLINNGTHTYPLAAIMAKLVEMGLVNPNHYIHGAVFGMEISKNSGSATVNKLSYVWG